MVEANSSKRTAENTVSIEHIEHILPTPVASPHNKQHDCDIEEIKTETNSPITTDTPPVRAPKRRAATRTINFSDEVEVRPKRPRGRPPKTEPTVIPPSEYKRLSPSDRKYMEMRIKNNEASRRSRLNRKGKEDAIYEQLFLLEDRHEKLKLIDAQMDSELEKWKKRLLRLAQY